MEITSTYKILKAKAFNENVDESWIDWAIEMIEAGYESENLYILAGAIWPYNQFELQELTNKVFQDLHLEYDDKETILKNYVYYLISNSIDHSETYFRTLRELKDICIDLDMDSEYMDFYRLYFAKDDLTADEDQWYWEGANRKNIDRIIKERFRKWIDEFEQKRSSTV